MVPELKGLALLWNADHRLLHRALEGLTDEQARERHDGANPILWIAAHAVAVRAQFAGGLGASDVAPAWAKQFRRGGEVEDVKDWPTLAELRETWDRVHAAFMMRVEGLTSAQLAAETPIPGLDKTLLGALGLAALHDAYHVGQIAAARRRFQLDRVGG